MKNSVFSAVVAGQFYPAKEKEVLNLMNRFLNSSREFQLSKSVKIKGAIAPHAGYFYSGQVAFNLYLTIKNKLKESGITKPDIYLFAPSHREPFRGIAVLQETQYHTPIGNVNIFAHTDLIANGLVHFYRAAFEREHSMEVHLPFIRHFFPESEVHPMVVGATEFQEVEKVIEFLEKNDSGEEKIYIISSDMSHFLPYERAVKKDEESIQKILNSRLNALQGDDACGYIGIGGMILAAQNAGWKIKKLESINSGDITGDHDRVVGYSSFIFYENY